jgi:murein DD-endopeptidase MepM/ murein hydrolase activator NlpD
MNSIRVLGATVGLALVLLTVPASTGHWLTLTSSTDVVAQGDVLYVDLRTSERVTSVGGRLDEQPLFFFREDQNRFRSLVGIDLDEVPGVHRVSVKVEDGRGRVYADVAHVTVAARQFGVQRLTLPKEKVELKGKILTRVLEEKNAVTAVFGHGKGHRLWNSSFRIPLNGTITGAFGVRRILNNMPRSPHSGVDIAAPVGTPVRSCLAGEVAFARELYLGGNTVIIDHGLGLFSIYMHLSTIDAGAGSPVEAGEIIGRVGSSGRVTGPHLHWGIRLMGARVDPLALAQLFSTEMVRR